MMAGVAGSELPSQEGKLFFELVGVCQESEKQLGNHLCHKPRFSAFVEHLHRPLPLLKWHTRDGSLAREPEFIRFQTGG